MGARLPGPDLLGDRQCSSRRNRCQEGRSPRNETADDRCGPDRTDVSYRSICMIRTGISTPFTRYRETIFSRGRGDMELPADAEVVEVGGSTVIPGLTDCHVHVGLPADNSFLQVDDPASPADQFMTTLLRHGVTTVRDTGNSNPDEVFRTFEQGRDGRPCFFGAGTILDGPADIPAPWRWPAIIDDEASARQETARLVEAGMDFIEVYVWAPGRPLTSATRTNRAASTPGRLVVVSPAFRRYQHMIIDPARGPSRGHAEGW